LLDEAEEAIRFAIFDNRYEEPYDVDEPQNKRQGRPNLYTIVEDRMRGQKPNLTQQEIQIVMLDWQQQI
jgi:hypothetical protein